MDKKEHVLLYLSQLQCPVAVKSFKDKDTRYQVFEWLLLNYDRDFYSKCENEKGVGRTASIAKQLFVIGLGGNKMSDIETFVSTGSDEKGVLNVLLELCRLIAYAKEIGESMEDNFQRDLDFPKKIARKSNMYFSEELELFPNKLLESVKSKEKIDPPSLIQELGKLLEKLHRAIAAFETKNKGRFDKVLVQDPNYVSLLTNEFKAFEQSIAKFNEIYNTEISHWKIERVTPNKELGTLIENVNTKQREWIRTFEAFEKSAKACRDIGNVGKKIDRELSTSNQKQHGPKVDSEEFVASISSILDRLKREK